MSDLLGGRLGVEAYGRYTEQLWFVYEALEADAERVTVRSGGRSSGRSCCVAVRWSVTSRICGVRLAGDAHRAAATEAYAARSPSARASGPAASPLTAALRRPLRRSDHPGQGGTDLGLRSEG